MAPARIGERPAFRRGDSVTVKEAGLASWRGTVLSVKPGSHSWWVEVQNGNGGVWIVPARYCGRE